MTERQLRHPRAGGDPFGSWVPAFARTTALSRRRLAGRRILVVGAGTQDGGLSSLR